MSDFKFKIPRLPEDVTTERKLMNLPRANNDDNRRDACYTESRNTSQVNVFNNSRMRSYYLLQPIRENVDDLTQPSTSRWGNFQEGNNNRDNIFHGSFPKLGNTSVAAAGVRTSRNNFMNIENESSNLYKKLSEQSLAQSMFGNRPFKYNVNTNSHSNQSYSVVNSRYNNSFSSNTTVFNDRSQNDGFVNHKFSSLNNASSCSLSNSRNPFFSTELLPESSVSRNISVNQSRNEISGKVSNIESFNRTNLIQKDSTIQFNSNQSALDNQSMVKSVLEASFVSIKEQIMNKLESFGQTLLRHDPGLEASFCKVAKEVKSIFNNNSVSMNQVMGTIEMLSTINCTSESIVFPKERMLQHQCGVQPSEPSKKPRNVLHEIQFGQSGLHRITLKEEKLKNLPKDDFSDHLDSPPPKSDKLKEVNLKDWCPVASGQNLTFSGLNDQNMELQTVTVKKRINSRRVQLINGSFCNLVGNLAKGRKFPLEISKKMANGLPSNWRILTRSIAMLQKPSNQNKEASNEFNHSLSDSNITLRSSRRDPRGNATKPDNRNDVRKSEDDFSSPKSSMAKAQPGKSPERPNKKQKVAEVKENNNNNKKVLKTDKGICSLSSTKKKTSKNENAKTPSENDGESGVLCVTRSGRVVKRPGDLWFGENFNTNTSGSKSKANSANKTPTEPPKDAQKNQSKRKRDASVKTVVEAKKSKSEKSKTTLNVEEKDENVEIQTTAPTKPEKSKSKGKNPRTKSPILTVNSSKKKKKPEKKKDSKKPEPKEDPNPFGNELNEFEDGLNDIFIPEINNEGVKGNKKKLKLLSMETPPLKYLRNNLKILGSCTPVQSPDWQISQHTQSEVKKFEKLRARAFRQKIPKNNEKGNAGKVKASAKNKDVDTLMNWISEREVKSPRHRSKVLKYVIPKRDEMEENEEEEEEEEEREEDDGN